jgi:hypothetical protein
MSQKWLRMASEASACIFWHGSKVMERRLGDLEQFHTRAGKSEGVSDRVDVGNDCTKLNL